MIIESENVKFIHDGVKKETKKTNKQMAFITVVFTFFLSVIIVFWLSLLDFSFAHLSEDLSVIGQIGLGITYSVILIVFIGICLVIFMKKVFGSPEDMDRNNMIDYMSKSKFEIGWFKNELIVKCTFADNSVSYNSLDQLLENMFCNMDSIEIIGHVDKDKPVGLEVDVSFAEKSVIANVFNLV